MISLAISAFVLALVAVGFAAAAWIISWRLTAAQDSLRSTMVKHLSAHGARLERIEKLASELKSTAPTALAVRVEELAESVARLAETHRRFAGRWHATRGHTEKKNADALPLDDAVAAMLELQRAPAASPGGTE